MMDDVMDGRFTFLFSLCRVGEKANLIVGPDYGYGARGIGPIPPNAVLVFEVEVMAFK